MVLVVMGVAGSGKSTLGAALAARLGWALVEADDLHPAANVAALRAGRPLTDADRAPWLAAVAARMARGGDRVVCCSALKAAYRTGLAAAAPEVRFVHLDIEPALARRRVAGRHGHVMPASLVDSQFDALEPPAPAADVLVLDASAPLGAQVKAALAFALG